MVWGFQNTKYFGARYKAEAWGLRVKEIYSVLVCTSTMPKVRDFYLQSYWLKHIYLNCSLDVGRTNHVLFSVSHCLIQRPAFFLPESLDISTDHGKIYFLKTFMAVITRIQRQYSILLAQYMAYSLELKVAMLPCLREMDVTQ